MAKIKSQPEEVDVIELIKGSCNLTFEMWCLLRRDAEAENRSESWVMREIIGKHYKMAADVRNPLRKPVERKERT